MQGLNLQTGHFLFNCASIKNVLSKQLFAALLPHQPFSLSFTSQSGCFIVFFTPLKTHFAVLGFRRGKKEKEQI
jgi:hypothetical protein